MKIRALASALTEAVIVCVLGLGTVRPAAALPVALTGANGSDLSALSTSDVVGGNLLVMLENASGGDVLVPAEVLSAVFFSVTGSRPLTKDTAVFALRGLPTGFELSTIGNVRFQYGTSLTEPSFAGTSNRGPEAVEPGAVLLLGSGIAAATALRLLRRPSGKSEEPVP